MSADQPDLGALAPADAVASVQDTSPADLAPADQLASPPGPPGGSSGALEIVRVPASGQPVRTSTTLAMGELYLLKASGTVDLGTAGRRRVQLRPGSPRRRTAASDVGVDIGVPQVQRFVHYTPTPPGPGRTKWFGGYRDDHVYYLTVTGEGAPLTLALTRPPGAAGSGEITVALFALSPTPSVWARNWRR